MFKLLSMAALLGIVLSGFAYADGCCCVQTAPAAPAAAAAPAGGNAMAQAPQAQANRSFSYQPGSYNGYNGYRPAFRNSIPVRNYRNAAAKAQWQY